MTHDEAYALLPDLVGLRVAGAAEAALRDHVDVCEVCRARRLHLERVARALEQAGEVQPHPESDLEERILAIPGRHPHRPPGRLRRRVVPAAVGLAAAASVAALVLALTRPDTPASPTRFQAQQTVALRPVSGGVSGTVELGVPSGATRVVRLKISGLPHTTGSFDLWFVGEGGAMRAGSFGPDADGNCVVDLTTPSDERWDRLAITPSGAGPKERVLATS